MERENGSPSSLVQNGKENVQNEKGKCSLSSLVQNGKGNDSPLVWALGFRK
ncbi:hypothetical protein C1645_815489 [Glomus cerebriforme]|uniref:Uncharacterized protein n=1 Tax=Glomus cerebriforme TaxID=658196 RepID=A0A397TDL2_9GLOM|nr:hypothetical protein C1645_815489 [Glomus cerebriforme]